MTRQQVVEEYFMEHRAKLIDIAAFLDRVDRARPARPSESDDFRVAAFRRALVVLGDGSGERARRILEIFSDPTTAPLGSAAGLKGAFGAYPPPA
jgi:hypothetical protein